MGGFCLLVELHREGSAPAASAAGLFVGAPTFQEPPRRKSSKKKKLLAAAALQKPE